MRWGSRGSRRRGPTPQAARAALLWSVAVVVMTTVLVGACSPRASAAPTASAVASEGASGPTPKPTTWPTLTVEASLALGAAHSEFSKMTADISAAIDAEDPARLKVAMDDALAFLTGNQTNIPRLQAYDSTKSVGDRLEVVYAKMIEGATLVRDGLTSGDGDAVERGFQLFFEGNTEYVAVAPEMLDLAKQAVFMKRILVR